MISNAARLYVLYEGVFKRVNLRVSFNIAHECMRFKFGALRPLLPPNDSIVMRAVLNRFFLPVRLGGDGFINVQAKVRQHVRIGVAPQRVHGELSLSIELCEQESEGE